MATTTVDMGEKHKGLSQACVSMENTHAKEVVVHASLIITIDDLYSILHK